MTRQAYGITYSTHTHKKPVRVAGQPKTRHNNNDRAGLTHRMDDITEALGSHITSVF